MWAAGIILATIAFKNMAKDVTRFFNKKSQVSSGSVLLKELSLDNIAFQLYHNEENTLSIITKDGMITVLDKDQIEQLRKLIE